VTTRRAVIISLAAVACYALRAPGHAAADSQNAQIADQVKATYELMAGLVASAVVILSLWLEFRIFRWAEDSRDKRWSVLKETLENAYTPLKLRVTALVRNDMDLHEGRLRMRPERSIALAAALLRDTEVTHIRSQGEHLLSPELRGRIASLEESLGRIALGDAGVGPDVVAKQLELIIGQMGADHGSLSERLHKVEQRALLPTIGQFVLGLLVTLILLSCLTVAAYALTSCYATLSAGKMPKT